MKKLFLAIALALSVLLFTVSSSLATVIFSDSFSEGFNAILWTLHPNTATPQVSSFGLKDDGNTSGYGLNSIATNIAKDTVASIDIKINANPSYVYLICRANESSQDFVMGELDKDGTTWGTQFIHGGGGRTQGTNWDKTPGVHHFEVDCTTNTVTIKEDGNTLYSSAGFQTFATEANQYFGIQYRFGDSELANFSLCDSTGCVNVSPTPTMTSTPTVMPTTTATPTPTPPSSATILYSNTFTSSVAGFNQFFNSCGPSNNGLSCTGNTGLLYTSPLSTIACVSADFTSPVTVYSSLFLTDDTSTWLNTPVALRPNYNGHISIDTSQHFPAAVSTVATPTGKHNYMLCKNGDTFTGYVDGVSAVSYIESGHHPVSFAVGAEAGVPVTNLFATGGFMYPIGALTPTPTPTPAPVGGYLWQSVGDMFGGRFNQSSTVLQDGRVLVAAGRYDNQTYIPYAEIYDPTTKTWSKTGSLNLPRLTYEPSLVTLQNGKALLAGGNDINNNDYATVELYDPTTGQWSYTGSLNTPRRAACTQVLKDGRVLVAAGAHGAPDGSRFLNSTEIYNPNTGIWTFAGTLTQGRDGATCILLHDGRVMIAGGEGPWLVSGNTAEIFDPATNSWSSAGTMPWGWGGAVLRELPNGKVLVAGGWNGSTVFTNAALWDPSTNTWTSTNPLPIPRVSAMSSLLPDGRLIVFGGNNFDGFLATSVIFDPATNSWSNGPTMLEPRATQTWETLSDGSILAMAGTSPNSGSGFGSHTAEILASTNPTPTLTPTPTITPTPTPTPVNNPPSISSIPSDSIAQGGQLSFTGSFSDADSSSWTGTVDYGDGSGVQSLDLSGGEFTLNHTYLIPGTYPIAITITDNQGATTTQTTSVTVNNVDPTVGSIDVPITPVNTGSSVDVLANFTDVGTEDTHTATIDWGDGTTTIGIVDEQNGSGSVTGSHTYIIPGTYIITITVTDNNGGVSQSTATIVVNAPPTVYANGLYTVAEGSDVTLNGTAEDDQTTLTYAWDLDNNGTYETSGQSVSFHGVDGVSVQTAGLQVCDPYGACGTDTAQISITNVTPTILSASLSKNRVNVSEDVTLSAHFTDPGVLDTHTATIDWGDGTTTIGIVDEQNGSGSISQVHAYTVAGTKHIQLTVTDKDGGESNVYALDMLVNHKPVATANGPYVVAEGNSISLSGLGTDADGDPLTYLWDLDNNGTFETVGQTVSFSTATIDGPSDHTIAVKVCDDLQACDSQSTTVHVYNVAPTVGVITAPTAPVLVGDTVSATAPFTDPGVLDTHTAVWNWGDATTSVGSVSEQNGSGTTEGTHMYTAPGVYMISVAVTDNNGDSGVRSYDQYIVVYNPDGGFVTGAGQINSPVGAESAATSATGKAIFGVNAKYQNGATVPTGNTKFTFKNGGFDFASTSYDWMTVSGSNVLLQGHGQINGSGNYTFVVSMVDGDPDTFRIKVTDASNAVIYDNQIGDNSYAPATEAISVGQIKIHQ